MRIEQADRLLLSYPCVYDTKQRRITAVDGTGRQRYRHVQVIQPMLWALKLARIVWHMPRYRRTSWPPRALQALHIRLFD